MLNSPVVCTKHEQEYDTFLIMYLMHFLQAIIANFQSFDNFHLYLWKFNILYL